MPLVGGFGDLREMAPRRIWNGVAARVLSGDKCSLGIVELDPNAVVPSHHHEHEQIGMVLSGLVRFTIGEETRELGPGETWTIPSTVPHEVVAGPDGAVVFDAFAPVRADWAALAEEDVREPRWP